MEINQNEIKCPYCAAKNDSVSYEFLCKNCGAELGIEGVDEVVVLKYPFIKKLRNFQEWIPIIFFVLFIIYIILNKTTDLGIRKENIIGFFFLTFGLDMIIEAYSVFGYGIRSKREIRGRIVGDILRAETGFMSFYLPYMIKTLFWILFLLIGFAVLNKEAVRGFIQYLKQTLG